jgi:hypothetical protein
VNALWKTCLAARLITGPFKRSSSIFRLMTPGPTEVLRFRRGTFEYMYDDYVPEETSTTVPNDLGKEARLAAAFGISQPSESARDDYRLRGWVGATEKIFGKEWDKGHFIAHSIGGAVDGSEANVFVQRRDLNRGWSQEGIRYCEMERYCRLNPGTFCFSCPLYVDQTAKPAFIEFGVLKTDRELWVECFDNR